MNLNEVKEQIKAGTLGLEKTPMEFRSNPDLVLEALACETELGFRRNPR